MNKKLETIVVGAGPAGLVAACLLAMNNLQVHLVTGPPRPAGQHDPRTIALMQASIRLLEHIGVWPGDLASNASPLKKLQLIDNTGGLFTAPTVTFSSHEIGADAFGWNIPVGTLQTALSTRADQLGIQVSAQSAKTVYDKGTHVEIELDNHTKLQAPVVIAADGHNSNMRRSIGITTLDWKYDQSAIAASFAHSAPHGDISREYHKPAGPLTTVPMPDGRSSLVWLERPDRAQELMDLPDREFARQLQLDTHGDLGLITEPGPRRCFAMRGLTATQFASSRVILVGEAAHVVPPIGAQGLNMSLRDAALAAELISDAAIRSEDIGSIRIMQSYNTRRRG